MTGSAWAHRLAAAAILAGGVLAAPAVADGDNPANTVPTFRLDPSVAVELKVPGQPSAVFGADFRISRKILEAASAEGERAVARAAAEVRLVREDERMLELELRASNRTRGEGEAAGTAVANIEVTVPEDLAGLPVLLTLSSSAPGQLATSVLTSEGTRLAPIGGKPGTYLLDGDGGPVVITAKVASDSADSKAAANSSVSFFSRLRAAPILAYRGNLMIRGGQETDAFGPVGFFVIGSELHCTGTVIAPHTVLTAAHCLKPYGPQIESGAMAFGFGRYASAPTASFPVRTGKLAWPSEPDQGFEYDPGRNHRDDIAVVWFDHELGVTQASVHRGTPGWDVLRQRELDFVGYGRDGLIPGSSGVKRTARWTAPYVAERRVSWAGTATSTCRGDSGGPAFVHDTQIVVSVASLADDPCTIGYNTRVDVYWPWLQSRLR